MLVPAMFIPRVVYQGRTVNIVIEEGLIAEIEDLGPARSDLLRVIPGMIDLHVHSRQPGGDQKEDWDHLWRAAVKGGVTTIVTMPNPKPEITTIDTLVLARQLAVKSLIKPLFWFGATPNNSDQIRLAAKEPDVVGIKMFMGSSTGDLLVSKREDQRLIFQLGYELNLPVATHSEDEEMIKRNLAAFSKPTVQDHHLIRSAEAEIKAVKQALRLASEAKCQLHICHVSTPGSVKLIYAARKAGQKVSLEVAPHHLLLDCRSLKGSRGGFFKMNPPLRSPEEREKLYLQFCLGLADTVGSDHAPHTKEEKSQSNYKDIPSGVPGVETMLPLLIEWAILSENWERLVAVSSFNASRILKILGDRGSIAVGKRADLVLIDPQGETKITNETVASKCGWSPFAGQKLRGKIRATIVGGEVLYQS